MRITILKRYLSPGLFLIAMLFAVTGCAVQKPNFVDVYNDQAKKQEDITPYVHIISPGDVLQISIYNEQAMSTRYIVDPFGAVSFPLIGSIVLSGMTEKQAAEALELALSEDYLKEPQAHIQVLNLKPVYVLGEVENPGKYEYERGLNILRAVALAGGYTHRANENKFELTHQGQDNSPKAVTSDRLFLKPGDTLVVKERFF